MYIYVHVFENQRFLYVFKDNSLLKVVKRSPTFLSRHPTFYIHRMEPDSSHPKRN